MSPDGIEASTFVTAEALVPGFGVTKHSVVLIVRKIGGVSETTQDSNGVEADFGHELVDKAWD